MVVIIYLFAPLTATLLTNGDDSNSMSGVKKTGYFLLELPLYGWQKFNNMDYLF